MGGPSLRSRFVIGTLLWTLGLLAIAHLFSLFVIRRVFPIRGSNELALIVALAVALMAIGLTQVRSGVSSVVELRRRLASVRDGSAARLTGVYPAELQPLVDDLNALLEHREQAIRRALAKAGDLAHGLKTPLAVLSHEASRADATGRHDVAVAIAQQIDRMKRQIEYHLAHARAAASGAALGVHTPVTACADALARTMQRLHAERGLSIAVRVPPDHIVRVQREDLDEMLGNVIDNACKWASARVVVSTERVGGERIAVTVDDDGPGIASELREHVLQRGVRADEAAPGSGLGLAIVRDLAELYGGSIALEPSPSGGLRARLTLPA